MGKSNRIKVTRANQKASSLGSYKKKEGMPNWAVNLIAILITVAILLSGIFLVLSSNGTILRMRTAAKSENFRVDGQMMTYYANIQYQNFLSNYSSILSSFSLDTSKPLKDQKFGDTSVNANAYDTLYLATPDGFDGTWYDYFMLQAEDEVETMLRYCEEAKKLGVELGAAEQKKIDDSIATISASATQYGYPLNAYIAATFGEGVKEKDLRHALELSELATLGMNALSDKLMGEIADDRVLATYEADPATYNQIDYSFYSFRVDYADISTDMKAADANVTDEAILAEYQRQIGEAQKKATALQETANDTEFAKYLLTALATDEYETQLEKLTAPTEGKPDEAQMKTIKDALIAQAVKEQMDGTDPAAAILEEGETYVGFGITMSKEYADYFNKIKTEVDTSLKANYDGYIKDKSKYTAGDTFSTWAFDAARVAGDTKQILTGDGSSGEELSAIVRTSGYFRADVYRLRTPQYKNADKTRNLSYMVFSTESEAKAAIEALQLETALDAAIFERIAAEKNATYDVLENYVKGDMGVDKFDEWVFAADRAIGSYTTTPIKLSDSSFVVLYYTAEGEEVWFASVKDTLFNKDFETYYNGMTESIAVQVKANVLKKINIGL